MVDIGVMARAMPRHAELHAPSPPVGIARLPDRIGAVA